jgi:hypothetical protein
MVEDDRSVRSGGEPRKVLECVISFAVDCGGWHYGSRQFSLLFLFCVGVMGIVACVLLVDVVQAETTEPQIWETLLINYVLDRKLKGGV